LRWGKTPEALDNVQMIAGELQVFLEACAEPLERFDAARLRAHIF
jgi:hypothetical protein